MSKEAMKLALEALELEDLACRYEKEPTPKHISKAITALKQALEQPEPEPVIDKSAAIRIATSLGWTPKREWQGLTDEEIEKATGCDKTKPLWLAIIGVSRAVEAKLKEKNT